MRQVTFIIFLFFLIPGFTTAQKQNNIWYFGHMAGLDFNVDPPNPVSSPLVALEGTASVCDPAGQLLFYTNGIALWDRNHNVMPFGSGLAGGSSSTQAALIVPLPRSCHEYYVFYTEDHGSDGGLYYSVVDMCLNNGLGDIVVGLKNRLVTNHTAEKITAVVHANNEDIWIVTHPLGSNQFFSYLLTPGGLNPTPATTTIGSFYPTDAHIGPIKASHNGTKIATSSSFHNICELFDFNRATGRLSNLYDLNQLFAGQEWVYGIEFSPNDSILYLSSFFINNNLYQIELETKQLTQLNTTPGNYHYGALQMGPDRKIYMARNDSVFLDVIHQPNKVGLSCQYDENGITLSPGTFSILGLPNFTPYSFFLPPVAVVSLGSDTTLCMGESLSINLDAPNNCNPDYLWSDGSTDAAKIITQPGKYWVDIEYACSDISDTIEVDFISAPTVSLNDTMLCQGDVIALDAFFPGTTYLWSDNSTNAVLNVNASGIYWVDVSNECFTIRDSIVVIDALSPFIALKDTSLCAGDAVTYDATFPGASYLWSDNSTGATLIADQPGIYWVELSNNCDIYRDSFEIGVTMMPDVSIPDTSLCITDLVVADAFSPGASYLWSDNSTGSVLNIDQPGLYWVEVSNPCFIVRDSFNVFPPINPFVALPDSILCEGETATFDATFQDASYLWSDNSTGAMLTVDAEGTYWVEVTNECDSYRDSFNIVIIPKPAISIADTSLCAGDQIILDGTFPGATYLWSDNSTQPSLVVSQPGSYWIQVSNSCFIIRDTFQVAALPSPFVAFADTVLCEGEVVTFDATFPSATFLWSDNSTNPQLDIDQEGSYWVRVTNVCDTDTDSFNVSVTFLPDIELPDTSFCSGLSVVLDATFPGATYEWSDGSVGSSLSINQEGSYWVEVTNECFTVKDFSEITETLFPDVEFRDTVLCFNHTLVLDASFPGSTYSWSDGSTKPVLAIEEAGNYNVLITNECGTDQAVITVTGMNCEFSIYMPDVFSPNGDGVNDVAKPIVNRPLSSYKFLVFDRWGDCVFISTDNNESWDGTYRNIKSSPGVYAYYADFESDLGIKKQIRGNLTLIR